MIYEKTDSTGQIKLTCRGMASHIQQTKYSSSHSVHSMYDVNMQPTGKISCNHGVGISCIFTHPAATFPATALGAGPFSPRLLGGDSLRLTSSRVKSTSHGSKVGRPWKRLVSCTLVRACPGSGLQVGCPSQPICQHIVEIVGCGLQ